MRKVKRMNTNGLVEISGGIKRLEEGRYSQTTNRKNMHRNQDDYKDALITPPKQMKAESGLTVLQDEPDEVALRHLSPAYWPTSTTGGTSYSST